jgi:parallel beta-helix repeat protein
MPSRLLGNQKPSILTSAALASLLAIIGIFLVVSSRAAGTCSTTISANLQSAVDNATAGNVICLKTGNYGTFNGTNKAITIQADTGASPQLNISFGSGDSNFTLDGMKNMGGTIFGGSNITIKNSLFTSQLDIENNQSAVSNILIDSNDFTYSVQSTNGGPNSKIFLGTPGSPANVSSDPDNGKAVTIKNNKIENGDLDGIHVGDGTGIVILNNTFKNLCDRNINHTDNIQFEGGTGTRIAGNYVYESSNCPTQGITSFDSGTVNVIIENNVVDVHRPWGIEFYSDKNSIIRHNTVVYHPDADCDFTGQPCGQIDINRKTADPAGSGTQVYDNITTDVGFNSGSTGTEHHNVSGQNARYAGGANPTSWAGYLLAIGSPGEGAGVNASGVADGTDIGINGTGGSNPPPPPTCTRAADINCDGSVNIQDVTVVLSNFGKPVAQASDPRADTSGNGTVDIPDMTVVLSAFGS